MPYVGESVAARAWRILKAGLAAVLEVLVEDVGRVHEEVRAQVFDAGAESRAR
jgi:hypothetical protein